MERELDPKVTSLLLQAAISLLVQVMGWPDTNPPENGATPTRLLVSLMVSEITVAGEMATHFALLGASAMEPGQMDGWLAAGETWPVQSGDGSQLSQETLADLISKQQYGWQPTMGDKFEDFLTSLN